MPPSDYIKTRALSQEPGNVTNSYFSKVIDYQPYFPNLSVSASDFSSVKHAALVLVYSSLLVGNNADNNGQEVDQTKLMNFLETAAGMSDQLSCTKVTGGITNALFRISGFQSILTNIITNTNFDSVLVRIFGAEGMIDRDIETSTYAALCHADIAYQYLGRFSNGRVEGWLDGYHPLQNSDLSDETTSLEIAKAMARLHCLFEVPEGELRDHHCGTELDVISVGLWDQLSSWMEQAKGYSEFKTVNDTERAKGLELEKIEVEVQTIIQSFNAPEEENGRPAVEKQLEISQKYWNGFAEDYQELNKKITIHSARELHRHMDLQNAQSVLEVGAGGGIGTQDLLTYLHSDTSLTVTDFSSAMIEQVHTRLASNLGSGVKITIEEANTLDLSQIGTSSKDRYVSNLCLPLVPEPDTMFQEARRVLKPGGIAGFTIWGQEENSGQFTIFKLATEEVNMAQGMAPHSEDAPLQSDLVKLRERIENAGFDQVVIWPYWAVTELWNSDAYVDFFLATNQKYQQATAQDQEQLRSTMRRIAKEWIANGKPIALETYIILARVAA